MRGLSAATFGKLISCMVAGTAARFCGVLLCTPIIATTFPVHRKNLDWLWRFAVSFYIFQLPKATVQATLGGVVYSLHVIAGPQGLNQGILIQQCSALTILIFASFGTMLVFGIGAPIALRASELDQDAGWSNKLNRYLSYSPNYVAVPGEEVDDSKPVDNYDDKGVEMTPMGYTTDSREQPKAETIVDVFQRVADVAAIGSGDMISGVKYVLTGEDAEDGVYTRQRALSMEKRDANYARERRESRARSLSSDVVRQEPYTLVEVNESTPTTKANSPTREAEVTVLNTSGDNNV